LKAGHSLGVATPVASVTAQTSYSDPTICDGSFLVHQQTRTLWGALRQHRLRGMK
jgi:hypothetical protein